MSKNAKLEELKRQKKAASNVGDDEDEIITDEMRQRRYESVMVDWFAKQTPSIRPETATRNAVIFCKILVEKPAKEAYPVTIEGLARELMSNIDWLSTLEGDQAIDPEDAEDIIRGMKKVGLLSPTVATKATTAAARERALQKIERERKAKDDFKTNKLDTAAREKATKESLERITGEVIKWQHGLALKTTMKCGHTGLLYGIACAPHSHLFATVSKDKTARVITSPVLDSAAVGPLNQVVDLTAGSGPSVPGPSGGGTVVSGPLGLQGPGPGPGPGPQGAGPTGPLVHTCEAHTQAINAVCWSPDGTYEQPAPAVTLPLSFIYPYIYL